MGVSKEKGACTDECEIQQIKKELKIKPLGSKNSTKTQQPSLVGIRFTAISVFLNFSQRFYALMSKCFIFELEPNFFNFSSKPLVLTTDFPVLLQKGHSNRAGFPELRNHYERFETLDLQPISNPKSEVPFKYFQQWINSLQLLSPGLMIRIHSWQKYSRPSVSRTLLISPVMPRRVSGEFAVELGNRERTNFSITSVCPTTIRSSTWKKMKEFFSLSMNRQVLRYGAVLFDPSGKFKSMASTNSASNGGNFPVGANFLKKSSPYICIKPWMQSQAFIFSADDAVTGLVLKTHVELRCLFAFCHPLQEKLDQLPAVDMQHTPANLPSKLHIFAYVDVLAQSLCSLHSDYASKLGIFGVYSLTKSSFFHKVFYQKELLTLEQSIRLHHCCPPKNLLQPCENHLSVQDQHPPLSQLCHLQWFLPLQKEFTIVRNSRTFCIEIKRFHFSIKSNQFPKISSRF
ncbi:hypothetical protein VP01_4583g1 [Puccinia sorghi]|uniref:Uncharacterized protein n=1 Tax=Puccinia sorghi TaxID=27349 RepID=A0A0L6UNL6_9BASI|nr:hypothetical protein VP01_4583g1 [Puccinia sorghi]